MKTRKYKFKLFLVTQLVYTQEEWMMEFAGDV
jgi:hypothetical protein